MSLYPYVLPPEEDLHYNPTPSYGEDDLGILAAGAALIHALQVARIMADKVFAPGAASAAAQAHLNEAIQALDRAGVRS